MRLRNYTFCRWTIVFTVVGMGTWLGSTQLREGELRVAVRRQVQFGPLSPGIACFRAQDRSISLNPARTAIVVMNMVDGYPSPGLRGRLSALAPRMNNTLVAARKLGMRIIHAPGLSANAAGAYSSEADKQHKSVLAMKHFSLPEESQKLDENFRPENVPFANALLKGDTRGLTPYSSAYGIHRGLSLEPSDYVVKNTQELWNVCRNADLENLIYIGAGANADMLFSGSGIRAMAGLGLKCCVLRDLISALAPGDIDAAARQSRPWETPEYVNAKVIRYIEHYVCPTLASQALLAAAGMVEPQPVKDDRSVGRIYAEAEVAAYRPIGASSCYRHLNLDWNWNGGYLDDYFQRADPVEIAEFLQRMNVDGVVFMSVPHHGYVTFQSRNTPTFPAIAGRDFYGEVIRECHKRGIAVMGFVSLARNWWYSGEHPEMTWIRTKGKKVEPMLDLNTPYLKYLVGLSQEVLRKYPLDALRYDTLQQPPDPKTPWSRERYQQLYDEPMPQAWNESNWRRKLDFLRAATTEAAKQLYEGNKAVKPSIEVWQNGFIQSKDFDLNNMEAGRYQDMAYIEGGDPFRQLLLTGVLQLKGTIVGHLFNMPRQVQRLCMALGARGYQFKAMNSETIVPDDKQWYYDNVAPFYGTIKRIQPYLESARPVPYIGVLFSEATRYRTHEYERDWYVYGILKPLSMSYLDRSRVVQFVSNLDLPSGDFSHLPLIVVPETSGLKPAELDGLKRYVRDGGQLVLTGEALRYDERGEPRADFALASEMGVSFAGVQVGAWSWRHATTSKGQRAVLQVTRAGPATLKLWMRKSNARVDQIVLTRDSSYQPREIVSNTEPGVLVIEAEAFQRSTPRENLVWRVRRDVPGFSGEASIRAELDQAEVLQGATFDETPEKLIDDPKKAAEVEYQVDFPAAGQYYVWLRQTHENNRDDSIFVGTAPENAIAMDFSDPSFTAETSGQLVPAEGVSGPPVNWPHKIDIKGLVQVRATAGNTLCRVVAGQREFPLLHSNSLGKGRFLYLSTTQDIGLMQRVIDGLVTRSPSQPTPGDKQVILTRQDARDRWVLHLLADGQYTVQVDNRFAAASKVVGHYPPDGWMFHVQRTKSGLHIEVEGRATDRLLVLQ